VLSKLMMVLWAASAPGVFALWAARAKTRGGRVGAWAGCVVALGVLALMVFEYLRYGRRDAQGAIMFVAGPAYAWIAAFAVACPIWLGARLWSGVQRARGRRR
jgi:hypothetical protein